MSRWNPENYESLYQIGGGLFSRVFLVKSRLKPARQLLAMKVGRKSDLIDLDIIDTKKAVLIMRMTLQKPHPFIVETFGSYCTTTHFVVFREYCPGGDLMFNIQKEAFEFVRAR
jgi:serine/threonine protein kinase